MNDYIDIEVFFDDENFTELFEVYLVQRPPIIVAEREYETVNVPGRITGELTRELGYKSKPFTLFFSFINGTNIKAKAREIVNWLSSKRKIHFSDDDDVYRIIQQIHFSDMTNKLRAKADFSLTLTTEPFWYKDEGITIITSSGIITNPSEIPVDAKMRIYSTTHGSVTVNGKMMVFNPINGYIDIENKNAYRDGISRNNDMQGQYPVFKPGSNSISLQSTIQKVEVDVRWAFR